MYEYAIHKVIKVVDGDTVDLMVDLGFYHYVTKRFRLWGIDAPEKEKETLEAGKTAQKFVEDWFAIHSTKKLRVRSRKMNGSSEDKYGRWVGDIYFVESGGILTLPVSLSDQMIEKGLAIPFMDDNFYSNRPKPTD